MCVGGLPLFFHAFFIIWDGSVGTAGTVPYVSCMGRFRRDSRNRPLCLKMSQAEPSLVTHFNAILMPDLLS